MRAIERATELGTQHGKASAEAWLTRFTRGGFADNFLGEAHREQLRTLVESDGLQSLGVPRAELTDAYDVYTLRADCGVGPGNGWATAPSNESLQTAYCTGFQDSFEQTIRKLALS